MVKIYQLFYQKATLFLKFFSLLLPFGNNEPYYLFKGSNYIEDGWVL